MLEIILLILLLLVIILIFIFRNKNNNALPELQQQLAALQTNLAKIESSLKEDFKINREENAGIAKDNRFELNNTLKNITAQSQQALKEINNTLDEKVGALISKLDENNKLNREELTKSIKDFSGANIIQLEKINTQAKDDSRFMREALTTAFKDFKEAFDINIKSFNDLQREKFAQMETKQTDLVKSTETKLESIRVTVEEKLEKTLSERLGQSFETVGKQLWKYRKGWGKCRPLQLM